MTELKVPFFRPAIGDEELEGVLATLRSGWLTTGPRVRQFEQAFAAAVGARHAVAVNSCTAALHLAVDALKLPPGAGVLLPTMTFAATAEVVRYMGAIPILVDCDPVTLNMDLADAKRKMASLRARRLPRAVPSETPLVGVIPVHVGGLMMDTKALGTWARQEGLWIVEDAAHAFPAASRAGIGAPWRRCGEGTADISCFSFYANKTITTGEGGMAVTENGALADRMRLMSLHGLSQDAWERYSGGKSWDYRIVAAGYKYNLTDVAAAIGIPQLARAEQMRKERGAVARRYGESFVGTDELEIPADDPDRIHSWHLYPIRLRLDRLAIDRSAFIERLKEAGVGCSVHWRPLHLHPYYESAFGWRPEDFPVATSVWERLVSLPIFPGMREEEVEFVVRVVRDLCAKYHRPSVPAGGLVSPGSQVQIPEGHGSDPGPRRLPFARATPQLDAPIPGGIARSAEAFVSLAGLLISAPLVAAAAAVIVMTSGRPAVFRQERVGRGGKPFWICKLRTMRPSGGCLDLTGSDDPRITRFGRFLRKTKIDELPQLWNVLKGEMSLVGPRPEVSSYVDRGNPLWQEILRVRPGITDPVSIQLRDEESLLAQAEDPERFYREQLQPLKLEGYVDYIRRRSWLTDVRILGKTLRALFGRSKSTQASESEAEPLISTLQRTDPSDRIR